MKGANFVRVRSKNPVVTEFDVQLWLERPGNPDGPGWADVSDAVSRVRTDLVLGQLSKVTMECFLTEADQEAHAVSADTLTNMAEFLQEHGWTVEPPVEEAGLVRFQSNPENESMQGRRLSDGWRSESAKAGDYWLSPDRQWCAVDPSGELIAFGDTFQVEVHSDRTISVLPAIRGRGWKGQLMRGVWRAS